MELFGVAQVKNNVSSHLTPDKKKAYKDLIFKTNATVTHQVPNFA